MSEQPNHSGKPAVLFVIVVFVLAVLGGAWYWFLYRPGQDVKEKARQEQAAREEAENKAALLKAQNKIKYDELIQNADAEFQLENWGKAQSLYSEASSLFPGEQYPKDQLALVNAQLDELAALEAKRTAGVVETVSSRTGRFYIILSSSIDDDLAMDFANKLAQEGHNVKIIQHDADKLFYYRVSVGDYATRERAESASTAFSNYSNDIWVLKY
ncbi:MAG: SPOR domain-containing protein [Marinoscillum sp.]